MYNASIYDKKTGGISVAEVKDGVILRGNAVQCTGYEGTYKYDSYFRISHPDIEILMDNCEAYKIAVSGLSISPMYRS